MRNYHIHHEHDCTNVAVNLYSSELMFDIEYGIVKRAKLLGVKGEMLKNFEFTDSDRDWALRQINTALGKVQSKLKCAHVNRSQMSSDELLEGKDVYGLPFHFEQGTKWLGHADNLTNLIHSFVVNYCIAEYLDMAGIRHDNVTRIAEESLLEAYAEINSVIIDTPKFIL